VTEEEWDGCADVKKLLKFAPLSASRKLRLFACACCRRVWHLPREDRFRDAVACAERFADGKADAEELRAARADAYGTVTYRLDQYAMYAAGAPRLLPSDASAVADAVAHCVAQSAAGARTAAARTAAKVAEQRHQARLVRDVFTAPQRPVLIPTAWLAWNGRAIPKLAHAVYEERELPSGHLDAARLGVLADMLEEAGCSDADILGHLRGPGPHARGCWTVDALSGRS
jgi:hypothetical protein